MASITTRRARGKLVYRVRIQRKGFPVLSKTFARLTDARIWAQRMEAAISEHRAVPDRASRHTTVGAVIDRYLTTVMPRKRPSTAVNQCHHLRWWKTRLGHLRLVDVTPAILVQARDDLARTHGASTTNRYLRSLSHVFSVAVREWQLLDDTPFRHIRLLREPPGRVRYLSVEERTRLLDTCRQSQNPWLYIIVILALSTGARKGELLGLRWDDVDLRRGLVTFRDTKNHDVRSVPLADEALALLRTHARVRRLDSDLVFPGRTGRPLEIKRAWYAALRQAGLANFRFHDLRHSAASYLAMSGASLADIAAILGHKTLAVARRYTHLSEQHTAHVLKRMTDAFLR